MSIGTKFGVASLLTATSIVGAAVGLSVPAKASVSTWNYTVSWGGAMPVIPVVVHGTFGTTLQTVANGDHYDVNGIGFTGDVIGVDPIITGSITWASCTLYVDGQVAASDYATRGDGHDVACLVRLVDSAVAV